MRSLLTFFILVLTASASFGFSSVAYKVSDTTSVDSLTMPPLIFMNQAGNPFTAGETNFNLPRSQEASNAGLSSNGLNPGVVIRAYNDTDTPWKLVINSGVLTLNSDSSVTLGIDNFKWFAVYAGVYAEPGNPTNHTGWRDSSNSPEMAASFSIATTSFLGAGVNQTVYTSNSIDRNHLTLRTNMGTEITVQFGIIVPAAQQAGIYSGTVNFLIESQ